MMMVMMAEVMVMVMMAMVTTVLRNAVVDGGDYGGGAAYM